MNDKADMANMDCTPDACATLESTAQTKEKKSFEPGPGKHIMLFADPMCSWCWGFQPESKKINDTINGRASFQVIMGGLRPGTTESWKGEMQTYVQHHWQEVENKTGQPFDYSRMEDDNFIYDTEPSCRAVICARELDPALSLTVYHDLQRAFYAGGKDITDTTVIADIVAAAGIDKKKFLNLFSSAQAKDLVNFDFNRTRAFGVKGFPSIVCADDGQYAFLAMGYRPFVDMASDLEEWLSS
ncbi:MAG: DsbA family protein [Rhodospirillaceae bacterium]|nr:DsbA family protein [Rhodospirillaceae bacterium]